MQCAIKSKWSLLDLNFNFISLSMPLNKKNLRNNPEKVTKISKSKPDGHPPSIRPFSDNSIIHKNPNQHLKNRSIPNRSITPHPMCWKKAQDQLSSSQKSGQIVHKKEKNKEEMKLHSSLAVELLYFFFRAAMFVCSGAVCFVSRHHTCFCYLHLYTKKAIHYNSFRFKRSLWTVEFSFQFFFFIQFLY